MILVLARRSWVFRIPLVGLLPLTALSATQVRPWQAREAHTAPASHASPTGKAIPSRPTRTETAGPGDTVVALVDVAVLPMDQERVLEHQTVVVRGRTIIELGPAAQVRVPAGARRVDGQGQYLLPGLGDMHVHLLPPRQAESWDVGRLEAALRCYLAAGVTTIRPALRGYNENEALFALRQRADRGELLAPHLVFVGPVSRRRPGSDELFAGTIDSITALREAGVEFLLLPDDLLPEDSIWIDTVVTAARRTGLRLSGPVPGQLGLVGALALPYAAFEHLQGYFPAVLRDSVDLRPWDSAELRYRYEAQLLYLDSLLRAAGPPPVVDENKLQRVIAATRQAGVWNVPARAKTGRMLSLWWGRAAATRSPLLELQRRLIQALQAGGAGLVLGTDAPTWGLAHGIAVHQELESLVAAGLTPYQALATATRNVATFLRAGDRTGTLAVGQPADAILIAGNPLEDVRHTARLGGVLLQGRWLTRAELQAGLDQRACRG